MLNLCSLKTYLENFVREYNINDACVSPKLALWRISLEKTELREGSREVPRLNITNILWNLSKAFQQPRPVFSPVNETACHIADSTRTLHGQERASLERLRACGGQWAPLIVLCQEPAPQW